MLNASLDSGTLPFWQPISLLNVDYKLCTRALAGRLLKVLHHVIHRNQACGVKG